MREARFRVSCAAAAATSPSRRRRVRADASGSDRDRRWTRARRRAGSSTSQETIPAAAGALTLAYPKWIPGEHGPAGPITDLVGLKISRDGRPVAWKRVPTDMWEFTCDVPDGPGTARGRVRLRRAADVPDDGHGAADDPELVVGVLYPRGPNDNATLFAPTLRLPAGWKFGTSLPVAREAGEPDRVRDRLARDAHRFAGARGRPHEYGRPDAGREAGPLAAPRRRERGVGRDRSGGRRRTTSASSRRRARSSARGTTTNYHFLLALSDHVPSNGLEHHESSDNRAAERSFIDDNAREVLGSLLSHEYVHSWNGKYRRPEGLVSGASADYQAPVDSTPALGLRGADRVLRRRPRRAQRPADAGARTARTWRSSPPRWTRRRDGRGGRSRTRRLRRSSCTGRGPNGPTGGAASTSTRRAS